MNDTPRLIHSLVMDRRAFCSGLSLVAAGTFVATALPLASVDAREVTTPETSFGGGHVDDIFGCYPTYSESIGYGRPQMTAMTQNAGEFPYWV